MHLVIRFCLVSLVLIPHLSLAAETKDYDLSIGLGVRYSAVGLSVEYPLNESIGVFGGLGISGLTAGFDYYLKSLATTENQYRLTASYGLVAEAECGNCGSIDADEKYYSYSLGAGIKREKFEASLFYKDMSEYEDDSDLLAAQGIKSEDSNSIGFSLGYIF